MGASVIDLQWKTIDFLKLIKGIVDRLTPL